MTTFNLQELESLLREFNPEDCAVFTNNCIVALESNSHQPGCSLLVEGDQRKEFCLEWAKKVKPGGYREPTEVTKNAAEAISFFLINELTPYRVVDQAVIGLGFDYWLPYDEKDHRYDARNFFKARIEISGIDEEDPGNTVEKRFGKKRDQTDKSDHLKLEAYISVVEFRRPWAKFGKK